MLTFEFKHVVINCKEYFLLRRRFFFNIHLFKNSFLISYVAEKLPYHEDIYKIHHGF